MSVGSFPQFFLATSLVIVLFVPSSLESDFTTPSPTPIPTTPGLTWVERRGGCIKYNNNKNTNAPNLEACKQKCDQERGFICRSVDYKASNGQCLLSVKWSGTTDVSLPCYMRGYTYAEKVPSSPPTPRFSWVERSGGCIKYNNNKNTNAPNLEACKRLCDQESGFICRSVDYEASSRQCLLSVKWSGTTKVFLPCYIKGYTYAEKVTWAFARTGSCITNFNNKVVRYINNIETCQFLCLTEHTFICKSLDYTKDKKVCFLSVENSASRPINTSCGDYTYLELQ